jgi:predicted ATPase
MFDHILFDNLADSKQFGYAAQVPFFKNRSRLDFKPGLNILVGSNGCGKSTVLKILGETLCATQGGFSTITEDAISNGVDMFGAIRSGEMKDTVGLTVAHDGQPVIYCDPRKTIGLVGGTFDDDFFKQGMAETMSRGSHGQSAMRRLGQALDIVMGQTAFPDKVDHRVNPDRVNDTWQRALKVLEKRLVGTIPAGQPTVLLDEPETNFSLVWQARLWELLTLPHVVQRRQVIVATHSAFALNIPHAHYIEFEPGFRAEAEAALFARFGHGSSSAPSQPRTPKKRASGKKRAASPPGD